VSTEGTSSDADGAQTVFDLPHVVAHEIGHALGLSDETDAKAALMYPYTMPDDASVRAPEPDDLAGVDALYAGAASTSSHGCGAHVAGGRVRSHDAFAAAVLAVAMAAWMVSRRRARVAIPVAAAVLALVAGTGEARSAAPARAAAPLPAVDAKARVVAATTRNVGGIFETDVDLLPSACAQHTKCPPRAHARVWGGAIGGVIQQVGEAPAPRVDDEVDVAFTGSASEALPTEAVVLAFHSPLSAL
jgi:hypothetical protein